MVTVVDRNGWVVYQSETPNEHLKSYGSMAKLDHFQYFTGHSGDSLFIGATRLGKMTGKYQYRVGRPLLKDGNFDGMVMLTLVPDQLMDPFKAMSLGRHSSVTMMTLEPKLIARLPRPNEDAYDRKMANLKESYGVDLQTDAEGQVFDVGSPFEPNSRRDIFFKRLPDYPIAIVVGVSELDLQDDMANARNSLFILAALFSASALIVAMLMLREKIQNRRLTVSLAANREAEEQLRIAAAAFDSQGGTVITDAEGVIIRVTGRFPIRRGIRLKSWLAKPRECLSLTTTTIASTKTCGRSSSKPEGGRVRYGIDARMARYSRNGSPSRLCAMQRASLPIMSRRTLTSPSARRRKSESRSWPSTTSLPACPIGHSCAIA
ncbi:hypothetical protein SDC9_129383 [bioreactor metagenome]|uniref:Uncharacterized protein n=1 Tax=bioreactor metagenome TaxID=1076179 RepID=A0A645D0J2_9ZZZZ